MRKIKVIRMGRAAGKTTQSLLKLQEEGGGIFITRHPEQAKAIVRQHQLDSVSIFSSLHRAVVIDDADEFDVVLTTNSPLKLDEIISPNVKPNPYPFLPKDM